MNSHTGIFVLILGIIMICNAQSECDQAMCNNVCNTFGLNGTCNGANRCDCFQGEKCSEMVNVTCDLFCNVYKLDGECDDNGNCICKAELEVCLPFECQEQCEEDPRAEECAALGGIVTAIWCLEYGPITTCGCLCEILKTNMRLLQSESKNKLNYFVPVKTKKSKLISRARLINGL